MLYKYYPNLVNSDSISLQHIYLSNLDNNKSLLSQDRFFHTIFLQLYAKNRLLLQNSNVIICAILLSKANL